MSTSQCPCQSGKRYPDCCEPFITEKSHPPTAEALMRSRYSAYVKGAIDHVARTHDQKSRDQFDRSAAMAWSENTEWLGLEVRATEGGGESDTRGMVEFVARYRTAVPDTEPQDVSHHEIANFAKEHGHWVYLDGKIVQAPVMRQSPKLGRNDPCSCGSGKKFKKCCG